MPIPQTGRPHVLVVPQKFAHRTSTPDVTADSYWAISVKRESRDVANTGNPLKLRILISFKIISHCLSSCIISNTIKLGVERLPTRILRNHIYLDDLKRGRVEMGLRRNEITDLHAFRVSSFLFLVARFSL